MNPLPGQINEPPPPIVVDRENEWEVEQILGVRKRYNRLVYRVKWVGHDVDLKEYKASDLRYAPHKLRDFHSQYKDLPGPPKRLDEWIKLWEEGVDTFPDHTDDDY